MTEKKSGREEKKSQGRHRALVYIAHGRRRYALERARYEPRRNRARRKKVDVRGRGRAGDAGNIITQVNRSQTAAKH